MSIVRIMCVMAMICVVIMCSMRVVALFFMMFTSRSTTWLTKESEVRSASHVRSGEERTSKSDIHEDVVAIVTNVVDDFIF